MCIKRFLRKYSHHIVITSVFIFIAIGAIMNIWTIATGVPTLIIVFYKFYLDELKSKHSKVKIKEDTSKNQPIEKWGSKNLIFYILIGNEGDRKAYIREINLKKIKGKKNNETHNLTKKDLLIKKPRIGAEHETIEPKDFIPSNIGVKLKNEHKIYEESKEKIKEYNSIEFKFNITVEDFQNIKYSVEVAKTIYPRKEIE